MPQSQITTWIDFTLQQMAAESYLDDPGVLATQLTRGNNRFGFDPPTGPLLGATRFTSPLADRFIAKYDIVNHHANDSTGFSATLMQERGTNNFTLSFRSSEYKDQVDGGDYERDGANGLFLTGADGEIVTKGFAFGQLAAMEDYYQSTVKNLLPPGAVLNVTGYSLGAHLATVFTELHGLETNTPFSFGHTYTFNGPGRGTFNVALPSESAEAQRMREMVSKLTQVLLDPDAGLPSPRPPDDQLPFGYILARDAQQADQNANRVFDPFAAGNTASVYNDVRYLWAKEVVSTKFGPLSSAASDIPRTDGAFSLITQIVGHASQGDTEYVANSGNHAAETGVFIEDQPNFDNFGGFFGRSGNYGTTHSITLIVDSLALQELFQTVAPALQQTEIEAMLWASSNELATGTTIGTSGTAEAKPLEHALDALRRLFLPGPVMETVADHATGGFGNLANRNTFYTNIADVKAALAGGTVTVEPFVELVRVNNELRSIIRFAPNEVVAEAQQETDRGLAFRYALKALNPFAVIGADYQALGHASNGALTLFDPATGFGELTEQYLKDRAAFLEAKIELNLINDQTSGDTIHYKDFVDVGYEIPTGSIFTTDRQFLFGSDDLDPLTGGSKDDHLYGGGGDDVLTGLGGDDYLQGDAGNDTLTGGLGDDTLLGGTDFDTYIYSAGDGFDTILDRDGQGSIVVDGVTLAGGAQYGDRRVHRDDNGHLYVDVGLGLVVDGNLLVQGYRDSDLNVSLSSTPVANPVSTLTLQGDLAAIDDDPNTAGVQAQTDSLGNVIVDPNRPEPGRADLLNGSGGADSIEGRAGSDILNGKAGNDRLYADTPISAADAIALGNDQPGSGFKGDWLAGGSGDDTLVGSAGNDVLTGGGGHDLLIGGAGDDDILGDRDWVATSFDWTVTDLAGGIRYYFPTDEFPAVDAADVIYAGEGNDFATGGGGNDVLFGEGGADILSGGLGNDILLGGTGIDLLLGGADDDLLIGGAGADTVEGGAGNDIYIFNRGDGGDTLIDSNADHNSLRFGAGISSSDITLRLGSLLLDLGSGDAVHIQNFNQHDVFNSSSIDRFEFADGTVLTVADLSARGFDLDGTAGDDPIIGTNTTDRITGYGGHDTLLGEAGNDTLDGGEGDDELQGGGGNDVLSGGAGDDLLAGDDPNDTLVVGGEDYLDGGVGDDQLYGEGGQDQLLGGDGHDGLFGGAGNDQLVGGAGDDGLYGGMENDTLIGGSGDDILQGGTGNDTLLGGAGYDTYAFSLGDGHDVITDAALPGEVNTLVFNAGIRLANLTFTQDAALHTLTITIGGAGESIDLLDFDPNGVNGSLVVQTMQFADGLSLNMADLFPPIPVITGTEGDEVLFGTTGADVMYALGGDDEVHGDLGDDLLDGGAGNDELSGEGGEDQLLGGAGHDALIGGTGNDILVGGVGDDIYVVNSGDGQDTITDTALPGEGNRVLFGTGINLNDLTFTHNESARDLTIVVDSSGTGQLLLTNFDPTGVNGSLVVQTLAFADGSTANMADVFHPVLILGTNGDDTLVGTARQDQIDAFEGDDVVDGLAGHDTISGGIGNDTLLGGAGDDELNGDEGDDVLAGNTGNDTLYGGAGDDLLDGGAGEDSLDGEDGDDILMGGADIDELYGGAGNDTLDGGAGNDLLFGELDDDVLHGGDGDDYLEGNAGNDTLDGGDGRDVLWGGVGNDVLDGGVGDDRLRGEAGDDTLRSGTGFADLSGGAGNDVLDARNSDGGYLQGDSGDDVLDGGDDYDFMDGGDGDDTLRGGAGSEEMWGGDGNDALDGGDDDDYISGDDGDDVLDGGAGRDDMDGGAGNDVLIGGAGDDRVRGGAGSDIYRFDLGDGVDTIEDVALVGEGNRIQFGTGITRTDLTVTYDQAVQTLTIHVGIGGTDTLVLRSFDPTGVNGSLVVDTLAFADGSTASLASLLGLGGPVATNGDDTITTGPGDDVIDALGGNDIVDTGAGDDALTGGTGNDQMTGGTGNDTYLFNLGDGVDTITDTALPGEGNTVDFGTGITPNDLSLGVGSLLIRVGTNGDAIHLTPFDPNDALGAHAVETFRFADGMTLSYTQLLARGFDLTGTAGNDVITGTNVVDRINGLARSDTIEAGEGNDALRGGAGHDTYLFNVGDGFDTIEDQAALGEGNRIQFGAGISQVNLTFTRDEAARTLTIQVGGSGTDKLLLTNFDPTGANGSLVVETLAFADGSTTNLVDLFHPNHAPTVATPLTDQTVPEDAPFTVVVPTNTFTDEDAGDALTLSASLADGTALPGWLSFDVATSTFSGTPDDAQVGTLDLKVTATDRDNLNVSDVFRLTVANVNEAPTIAFPVADQTAAEDSAFAFTLPSTTFADEDVIHGDVLTYSATLANGSSLPAWLNFNPNSRKFSGAPGAGDAGSLQIAITATDTGNLGVIDLFTLAISGPLPQTLIGTAGNDVLTAGRGDDTLIGLASNDLLNGGVGSDTMIGGSGDDIYVVDASGDVVTELPNEGFDTVVSNVTSTLSANVEALVLTDSNVINGTGNSLENGLTGNNAANVLDGGTGADMMAGFDGDDVYMVDNTGDVVIELTNQGNDTVHSNITYTLGTNVENLTLTGTAAINGTGNSLANVLVGSSAANVLTGGAGNDTYVVDVGDTVVESRNSGVDTVQSAVSWTLGSNLENLTLLGAAAINGTGNRSANVLTGNSANNVLNGSNGADTLRGGLGNDTVNGGSGNDIFLFGRGDGQDLIQDSSGSADKMLFDGGINPLDLVISRQANNLRLSIHDSSDQINVQNWYTSSVNRTETIQAGNGQTLLSTQVDGLIQAMAQFSADNNGMTWDQGIVQKPQEVQEVLAASWQSEDVKRET